LTVITPFFPTFFMADEIRSPTLLSPFADMVATYIYIKDILTKTV
jgi:hypothetical protein